jgi:hypothetical protein
MKMKDSIKIGIPIVAILGVIALVLLDDKSTGLLITMFFTPLLVIYALIAFRSNLKSSETKLKSLFAFFATTNAIVIVLHLVIRTMHYPFYGITKFVGALLCILTLVVGLIYILINRKQISSRFSYELIIMLFPAIIFTWSMIPYNLPPQLHDDYIELILESNKNLEITNKGLIPDSCQLENLSKIAELKAEIIEIIEWSGGYEGNRFGAFFDGSCQIFIDEEKDLINGLEIKSKLKMMILNVKDNGEAIFLLTQIESALRLKRCH